MIIVPILLRGDEFISGGKCYLFDMMQMSLIDFKLYVDLSNCTVMMHLIDTRKLFKTCKV